MTSSEPKAYYFPGEFGPAVGLRLSSTQVARLCDEGAIPFVRVGRLRLIPREAVERVRLAVEGLRAPKVECR